ncbi:MAG: ATP-dependent DNA helicase RecG [[Clostridium] spiroforme]|uniref:ATP-dependent DNA helicase RecG n=1 Tax=Thomasclavelia spiroformis TaxID=29348 RepID=A0A943I8G8_9FIRM|nr:ATP-dependent DNA helicase RecG [Thomasclavelia spiroformis]MBS5589076.1 ATP-dependent DNA helicase RecG [Thomasclavelia spiroformis]
MLRQIPLKQIRISDRRIEALNKMNIYCLKDLVLHFPYRYDSIEATTLIDNEKITIEAMLVDEPKVFYNGRISRMTFRILYNHEIYQVTIFNRHFLKKNMVKGMVLTIIGKYSKGNITASDIRLKKLEEVSGIIPVYSLKDGLTQKSFQNYIKKALAFYQGHIQDEVPIAYMVKHHLIHKELALNLIHFPNSNRDIQEAMRYLKYEEFLKFQLTMQYIKLSRKKNLGVKKQFDQQIIDKFINELPFTLTTDQKQAVNEIMEDLKSDTTMYRFVQGDVGSGKTVVGAIGLYANYLAGFQGALMAPTEILATQHFISLQKLFKDTDINLTLLTGHLPNKEKQAIYQQLSDGKIDIVIGTHALFQEKVNYHKLGLVITDEQHRFGVNQRKALKEKGQQVDFMVMSATPIPRTLAISLYGDMDVSTIKTMPKGRKTIISDVIRSQSMRPILNKLKAYLASGGQCYVVCPLVEESEVIDSKAATSIYAGMKSYFSGHYEVGLLHGKMDEETKNKIMEDFKANRIQILVSTTVIEVGVDVENANWMVVYNAERFGLSQLHQLRGRVGRGDKQGYCFLLTNSKSKEALERLEFLKKCYDGFEVSFYDLKLRGPGDILGDQQSGLPNFIVGDVFKDVNILEVSRKDALELLKNKSNDPVYLRLIKEIEEQLVNNNKYID